MTFVSVVLVDSLGRRLLLLCSGSLSTAGTLALAAYFYVDANDSEIAASIAWLPLVSILVLIAGYSIGLGPIPAVLSSEILPHEIRGEAIRCGTRSVFFSLLPSNETLQPQVKTRMIL